MTAESRIMSLKYIKQHNRWSCMLCAFCMALHITIEEAITVLGHDGSEDWFDAPFPANKRGFHQDELTDLAYHFNHAVITINFFPLDARTCAKDINVTAAVARLRRYMAGHRGVLLCLKKPKEGITAG